MGFTGVYVLGDQAHFALVDMCYGSCANQAPYVVPFRPPAKFFPVPSSVYAAVSLDEPFPTRDVVDGVSKTRTHLCSLATNGTPRCVVK
jgi:hypothetical protein